MSKKLNLELALDEALDALENIAVRFPIDRYATKNGSECSCIQFEDTGECRHIVAVKVLEKHGREV